MHYESIKIVRKIAKLDFAKKSFKNVSAFLFFLKIEKFLICFSERSFRRRHGSRKFFIEPADDFVEEITPNIKQGFLKTLAALKSGDPKIYDEMAKFFDDKEEESVSTNKNDRVEARPRLFLKDYERKVMMEKGGWNFLFHFHGF